jgi:hypothetical protein
MLSPQGWRTSEVWRRRIAAVAAAGSHGGRGSDTWIPRLVQTRGPDAVGAIACAHEHFVDLRMADRPAGWVSHKILLRYIGDIFRFGIFGKKVIERLIFMRPHILGDGLPPFLGVGKNRVHVVNDPPERMCPVADKLADTKFRNTRLHGRNELQRAPNYRRPREKLRHTKWRSLINSAEPVNN